MPTEDAPNARVFNILKPQGAELKPLTLDAGAQSSDMKCAQETRHTIVCATVGTPKVLVPTLDALFRNMPRSAHVVFIINPLILADGATSHALIEAMASAHADELAEKDCRVEAVLLDRAIGFGSAHNVGVAYAAATRGLGKYITFYNDDLRATPGWADRLAEALDGDTIQMDMDMAFTQPGGPPRRDLPRSSWGRVGLVGPVTTVAAGAQGCVQAEDVKRVGSHDDYARLWSEQQTHSRWVNTTFLSGFCVMASREALLDLLVPCSAAGMGIWDGDRFPIAGYEDNDLCVRAMRAGWRLAVDHTTYVGHVGHQTFDAHFPDFQRGMRNRAAYYAKWRDVTQHCVRLTGVMRVALTNVFALHTFMQGVKRHAHLLNGLAVYITNLPGLSLRLDREAGMVQGELQEVVQALIAAEHDAAAVASIIEAFIKRAFHTAAQSQPHLQDGFDVSVVCVPSDPMQANERDERNAAIQLAYSHFGRSFDLDCEWLISIDHDEIIEDRITRQHLVRWMQHPDPLVMAYDVAWLDHYNSHDSYRHDGPIWGDGANIGGARHGRRLWRVWPHQQGPDIKTILLGGEANGLHCGNVPDVSAVSVRVAALRFRHFGYTRREDRRARLEFYKQRDPNPDVFAMGASSYDPIVVEDNMMTSLFVPNNGIALTMLFYSQEDPDRLASMLDALHGIADLVNLTWTDRAPFGAPVGEGGPSEVTRSIVNAFNVAGTMLLLEAHDVWDDAGLHMAKARNVGIEALDRLNRERNLRLGWGLFFDPDEVLPAGAQAEICLRQMAQFSTKRAFIVPFVNIQLDGGASGSESVRMFRLDMRMAGRVHESFDDWIREHQAKSPNSVAGLRMAPFNVMNPGLANPKTIAEKIVRYTVALVREVEERPTNGGAWASLGLQFQAEGRLEAAERCFMNAITVRPDAYVGYRALAALQGFRATQHMRQAINCLGPAYPGYNAMLNSLRLMEQAVLPVHNPAGRNVIDHIACPTLPMALLGLEETYQPSDELG